MLNFLSLSLKKTAAAFKNFLSATKKQWTDSLKESHTTESQCRRCGSCKHLCSYMKTNPKGDRDVQIS